MFVPIEGAFAEALNADGTLAEFALNKGILLTTPTTLTVTLKTAANIWQVERRNRNAEEIARQAGRLYDKLHGFLESMNKVGQHLDRAQDSYSKACGQLSTGRGNIVSRAENLKLLGASTTKQIENGDFDDEHNLLE